MNSAAISLLAETGIRGVTAEASLRHVLSTLAAQGDEVRRVLAELAVPPESVDPSLERTVHIVRRLADAGLRPASARTLFGADGGQALMTLIEQIDRFEALERRS